MTACGICFVEREGTDCCVGLESNKFILYFRQIDKKTKEKKTEKKKKIEKKKVDLNEFKD